jgi:hypothetical protein
MMSGVMCGIVCCLVFGVVRRAMLGMMGMGIVMEKVCRDARIVGLVVDIMRRVVLRMVCGMMPRVMFYMVPGIVMGSRLGMVAVVGCMARGVANSRFVVECGFNLGLFAHVVLMRVARNFVDQFVNFVAEPGLARAAGVSLFHNSNIRLIYWDIMQITYKTFLYGTKSNCAACRKNRHEVVTA